MNANKENQVRSKKRVADHGEVFTADREVNAMLDLVKQETERIDSRFLEPACGTGNFLVEILKRKLKVVESRYGKSRFDFERNSIVAISSIYGIDILEDNVLACRKKLFETFDEKYDSLYGSKCDERCRITIEFILSRNILWGDALSLKTVDGTHKPIIFSEWSALNGFKIKRRDFTLAHLLESQPAEDDNLFTDSGDESTIPKPVKEFPLTHFLKLADYDEDKL